MIKKISLFVLVNLFSILLIGCSSTHNFLAQYMPFGTTATPPAMPVTGTQLATDNSLWQNDAQTIWNMLQHIPLKTLEATQSNNPVINAWVRLAITSKVYNANTPQLVSELMTWRNENPTHPANALFPDNASLENLLKQPAPHKIALLLPLQGRYAASGRAVKQGFITAYYKKSSQGSAPQIAFYDTTNGNISQLYQRALNEGADHVIGPLLKEDVQQLLRQSAFNAPTVALNYTDNASLPVNFYEFGLSPNDEALQLAAKARQRGLSHAILIAPQSEWGQSVSKTLISQWQSLGGSITASLYYETNTDFSNAIPTLLGINAEQDRNKMREDHDKQSLEQQRRQDFDVVFLLAPPPAARAIVPFLRYYYLGPIPIYATSVVYAGTPDPNKDNDLNGVIFCDIPWTIKQGGANRLVAVGQDAYLITMQLNRLLLLPNWPIYGSTGALTMTAQHTISRRLLWTRFHAGQP